MMSLRPLSKINDTINVALEESFSLEINISSRLFSGILINFGVIDQ